MCRMKVNFNCCPRPTLFKGEKPPVAPAEPVAKINSGQPAKDTAEIAKKPEGNCVCTCECKDCK